MNFRTFLILGALWGLAACQPAVPDSGPAAYQSSATGIGYGNAETIAAREARDAQLASSSILPPEPVVSGQPLSALRSDAQQPAPRTARAISDPQSLDAELAAGVTLSPSGREIVNASPSNAAPVLQSNPGISDENSFDAVSGRETIASDAARIEANRAQYQVVQPSALPERTGPAQPNVVQYALQTSHPKGTKVYNRLNIPSVGSVLRSCSRYASPDEAQIDFLARGGPERDRRGLDPDGDGYACDWDPAPFRTRSGG